MLTSSTILIKEFKPASHIAGLNLKNHQLKTAGGDILIPYIIRR